MAFGDTELTFSIWFLWVVSFSLRLWGRQSLAMWVKGEILAQSPRDLLILFPTQHILCSLSDPGLKLCRQRGLRAWLVPTQAALGGKGSLQVAQSWPAGGSTGSGWRRGSPYDTVFLSFENSLPRLGRGDRSSLIQLWNNAWSSLFRFY